MSEELNLIPTESLIEELKSRFDDLVIAGQKYETDKSRLDTWDFSGDYTNCLGLCSLLQHKINQDRDEASDKLESAP